MASLGVTLCEAGFEGTAAVLEKMGFWRAGVEGNRYRFSAAAQELGSHVDVLVQPQLVYGRMGAWQRSSYRLPRSPNDAAQLAWREELKALDLDITPVLDRTYFHSIYFREPGGVFIRNCHRSAGVHLGDEPIESLGESLKNCRRGLSLGVK